MSKLNSFFENHNINNEGYFDTGDGHQLYFSCFGNPKGKPIVILHGGPGYGSELHMLRFYNPKQWNILLFDQRGAGRSKPTGSIYNNTTQHLIDDINRLTNHVGFNTFTIKGESWGTTLALAYAQSYPQRVIAMILIGIFLGDREGSLINRVDGAQRHLPDIWENFINALPENERSSPFEAYYRHIFEGSEEERFKFAKEAIAFELAAGMMGKTRSEAIAECDTFDFYSVARIEYHYLMNKFFLKNEQLLEGCEKIKHIPISIIHGRYDMICSPESAWKLSKKLKNCDLIFSEPAGHTENEPITSKLLLKISEKYLNL